MVSQSSNKSNPIDVMEADHAGRKPAQSSRPVVLGSQGVVSSGHCLTSMSAARMLLSGGNAFDAAVAAGFAAAVVEPAASYTLCSEGTFMVYHAATGHVRALSGQGVAPGKANIDLFESKGLDKIPTGPGPNAELSFTIPGIVDALLLMLETYGTKTLAETLEPALEYAQRGMPMYERLRESLMSTATLDQFRLYPPGGLDVFYQDGEAPDVGQPLRQPQLAATLQALIEAERAASGSRVDGIAAAREAFYRGPIAETIVRCAQSVGGLFSAEDMASYQAGFDEPLKTDFMGFEVFGQPTWTQGAVLLQALNILEGFDLKSMGHNSADYIHTVTEALKLAFADREQFYGDPKFSTLPIDGLLSKEYAKARAALIDGAIAMPEMPEPGDPWRFSTLSSNGASRPVAIPAGGTASKADEQGTTHFAVIDRDGSMAAATPSGGVWGKSVYFPEIGCALSTRSEMFVLERGHPNSLEGGKRPRTTLVNYLVAKNGVPFLTAGCPGGDAQAQANLQLILNSLVFGMDPQEAVEAPRFATQTLINSFYPRVYLPGQLNVEKGTPADVRTELEKRGHKVTEVNASGTGAIVTRRDPESGGMAAGADPRRDTYAIGW